jgi:nitrogen regulatory protein P-II 1
MKMVQAIIRPEKMPHVKKALEEQGFIAMSITEMTGRGEQKGIVLQYRGNKVEVDTLPKIKLEMVVRDGRRPIISIIRNAGRTRRLATEKIFVLPVEMMCQVRTDGVAIMRAREHDYTLAFNPPQGLVSRAADVKHAAPIVLIRYRRKHYKLNSIFRVHEHIKGIILAI